MLPSSEVRDHLARGWRALTTASVVSEGRAGAPPDTPTRGAPGSAPPRGQGPNVFDVIADRFREVTSLEQLEPAVDFAEKAIAAALRSPSSDPETALEFRARLIRDYPGPYSRDVARSRRSASDLR